MTSETQDTYNDESAAVSEEDAGSESYVPEPQSPNMEFKSGTLLADGDGYKVRLDYTEEAQIPGVLFSLRERSLRKRMKRLMIHALLRPGNTCQNPGMKKPM